MSNVAPSPPSARRPARVAYLLAASMVAGASLFVVTAPAGVDPRGWHALGLLIPVIIVWATEAVPVGIASLFFLALVVAFQLVKPEIAFKGFTHDLPWLMVGAFALGKAMEETGLSRRIAYFLLSRLRGFWGVTAAAYAANACFMAVPSSEARSGVLSPVLASILATVGHPVRSNLSRLLTYYFCNATNSFVGNLFLTGGVANMLLVSLYAELTGKTLGWGEWLTLMALPELLFTGVAIAAAWAMSRPEPELLARLEDGRTIAEAYARLGPVTAAEIKVLALYLLAVLLWIFGRALHLQPGFAALIILGLLFLPGIGPLPAKALREINWNVVLLLGAVAGLAGILDETGILKVAASALIGPVLDPLAGLGLFGIAIGCIAIGLIAHFLLPGPANLTLALPLLVSWGLDTRHLPEAEVLAFLALLTALGDKLIMLSYQVPTYYTFLSLDVTDVPRFNLLLIKLYPVLALAILLGAFLAYGVIKLTGIGA
jgi:solute carrier family 13 (sodium-dependent dicarboxylate transporter), member 2/3/5